MIIREAMTDDVSGIILVWQAAFVEKVKPRTVISKVDVADHITLVALKGCLVVGFGIAFVGSRLDNWRIDYIAAHPIDAPKGTGFAILCALEERAYEAGVTRMTLAVRRNNARSNRMIQRGGWKVIKERDAGFTYEKRLEGQDGG